MNRANSGQIAFGPRLQLAARETIETALDDLGYIKFGRDHADFLVVFSTYTEPIEGLPAAPDQVSHRVFRRSTPPSAEAAGGLDWRPEVHTTVTDQPLILEESSRLFILDVVDAKTRALLWRGYTRRNDTAIDAETLRGQLDDLLAAFPFRDGALASGGRQP